MVGVAVVGLNGHSVRCLVRLEKARFAGGRRSLFGPDEVKQQCDRTGERGKMG